ncbi:unnamed protein product [Ranitomeya imitator]|uniref:Pyrin domain-containing protein n=1 Tax=Ranitomeya imitator TaxID=111125 RepID=A0ABN9MDD9_9NEOB|nr:unnamed protein product [Ranitomeya imitator]
MYQKKWVDVLGAEELWYPIDPAPFLLKGALVYTSDRHSDHVSSPPGLDFQQESVNATEPSLFQNCRVRNIVLPPDVEESAEATHVKLLKASLNIAENSILNRVGGSTPPCFTPFVTGKASDSSPSFTTFTIMPSWNCRTIEMNLLEQSNFAMIFHRPSLLTVSKAWVKSTKLIDIQPLCRFLPLGSPRRQDAESALRHNEAVVSPAVCTAHGLHYSKVHLIPFPGNEVINEMPMPRASQLYDITMTLTLQEVLVRALKKLEDSSFQRFIGKLNVWKVKDKYIKIPKNEVMGKDPEQLADLINKYYKYAYGAEVTLAVLSKINEKSVRESLQLDLKEVDITGQGLGTGTFTDFRPSIF